MPKQLIPPKPSVTVGFPLWQQVLLRLSLMMGTGLFVGIGIAAEVSPTGVLLALTLAAGVALINAWGETQIVANDAALGLPLCPDWLQFAADWTLFLGKLTAAAAAALGLAGYLLITPLIMPWTESIWLVPTAVIALLLLTAAVYRRQRWPQRIPTRLTTMLAAVSLLGLVLAGLPQILSSPTNSVVSAPSDSPLQAIALMVITYASYENFDHLPLRHTTPAKSLIVSGLAVLLAWLLYGAVAVVALRTVGASILASATIAYAAPLAIVMQSLNLPGGVLLICLGAVAAMAGILLSLLPKLAEQLLDFNQPARFTALSSNSTIDSSTHSPKNQSIHQLADQPAHHSALPTGLEMFPSLRSALVFVGVALSCILLAGDIKVIWSFSAFAFLLHAALIHWMSLRRFHQRRLYPKWLSAVGLGVCLFLAFWVEWSVWLVSLGLVALGLIWRGVMQAGGELRS